MARKPKPKNGMLSQTSGRRKTAIARLTLYAGKGNVRINGLLLNNTEWPDYIKNKIMEPLLLAPEVSAKYDYFISANGGGITGQADAIRLAIGKALVKQEKKLEKTFLAYDRQLLVADIRVKEQYKPNDSKARSRRQKSYR